MWLVLRGRGDGDRSAFFSSARPQSHVPDCVLGHCGRGGWSYYYEAVSPAFDIWTNEFTSSTEYAILDKSEPLWTEA